MPVDCAALLAVSRSFCIPNYLVNLVGELYSGTKCHVRTTEANSEAFEVKTGVRQGRYIMSPLLFISFLDCIVKDLLSLLGGAFHVEYSTVGGLFLSYRDKTPASAHIQDAMYTDDMALIAESRSESPSWIRHVSAGACILAWKELRLWQWENKNLTICPSQYKGKHWKKLSPFHT